ncbi:MAG: hypothetical protein HFJ51_05275 [Clostridia bacterium]|nr:hypothetical protein [Clostridia bacterium]
MPGSDVTRIIAVYRLLETLGVNRFEEGAVYVAFMVSRLKKDPYETLESLYASAASQYNSEREDVENKVVAVQVQIYKYLESASARFHPELGVIVTEYFEDNPLNIKNTQKFLEGIMRAVEV